MYRLYAAKAWILGWIGYYPQREKTVTVETISEARALYAQGYQPMFYRRAYAGGLRLVLCRVNRQDHETPGGMDKADRIEMLEKRIKELESEKYLTETVGDVKWVKE